jgi:hypothetical protein
MAIAVTSISRAARCAFFGSGRTAMAIASTSDFGSFLDHILSHHFPAISARRTKQLYAEWCGLRSRPLASALEYKRWKSARDREFKEIILPHLLDSGRIVATRVIREFPELQRLPSEPLAKWTPGDPDIDEADYARRCRLRFDPSKSGGGPEVSDIYWTEENASKWVEGQDGLLIWRDPLTLDVSEPLSIDESLDIASMFVAVFSTDRNVALTWKKCPPELRRKLRSTQHHWSIPDAFIRRDGVLLALHRELPPNCAVFDNFHSEMVKASIPYEVW